MTRLKMTAIPIAAAAVFAILPVATFADSDPELGSELYAEFCAGCHGADASGLSNFSDDAATFAERIEEGMTENMPDYAGVFEEDEIAAMFAYLSDSANNEP